MIDGLKAMHQAHPEARIIAFADLSSRMILAHVSRDRIAQEQLEALCKQALSNFEGPLCQAVSGAVSEAMVLGAEGVHLFMRSSNDPSDAVCLVGDATLDVDSIRVKLRSLLDEVETGT